ncbi:MAG: T9SS type A sorting domain-containing protein [Bacteroidetes bacterium]|nr:T9SS type A sorting domain-containing protein [Bacteroidota bacterium]
MVNAFESAANQYVEDLKVISGIIPLNGLIAPDLLRSDHAPFWFKGLPALFISDGAEFRNSNYHELTDDIDSLDFEFMMQVTQTSIATMAELAGIKHAVKEDFSIETIVTGIHNSSVQDCALSVFPNPTTDMLWINTPDCFIKDAGTTARLFDAQGREVINVPISGASGSLDVSGLSCGQYILEISNEKRIAATSVLVQ